MCCVVRITVPTSKPTEPFRPQCANNTRGPALSCMCAPGICIEHPPASSRPQASKGNIVQPEYSRGRAGFWSVLTVRKPTSTQDSPPDSQAGRRIRLGGDGLSRYGNTHVSFILLLGRLEVSSGAPCLHVPHTGVSAWEYPPLNRQYRYRDIRRGFRGDSPGQGRGSSPHWTPVSCLACRRSRKSRKSRYKGRSQPCQGCAGVPRNRSRVACQRQSPSLST